MPTIEDNKMRLSLKRDAVDYSYDIIFGEYLFPQIADDLLHNPLGKKYAIITDSNVEKLYAGSLKDALARAGLSAMVFSFEAGEPNKDIYFCADKVDEMSQNGFGRDAAIIALGGGVVGDMAGFIASIFNRGIPYIQVPTTVLAQADSSIGGKTAVNTRYGKNLIGAFYHPKKVYIDVSTLKTLSDRDYICGLAETIKHGMLGDKDFFDFLLKNYDADKKKDPAFWLNIAKNNCRIKGQIVEIDPDEKGIRAYLNYGHTIGHAVEQLSLDMFANGKHKNFLSHGEAVSIGMMVVGEISWSLGYLPDEDLATLEKLLKHVGLPVRVPSDMDVEDIIQITLKDKKARDGMARYVLPIKKGKMHDFGGAYTTYVAPQIVREAIKARREF
jgi:3-dehydroquinate synthase